MAAYVVDAAKEREEVVARYETGDLDDYQAKIVDKRDATIVEIWGMVFVEKFLNIAKRTKEIQTMF